MIQAPCKNCSDRHPICHDTCKKYQTFKVKHEEEKQKSQMYTDEYRSYKSTQKRTDTTL